MAKPRNDLLDRLVYCAARLVSMFMYCWPVQANLRLAQWLGNLVYRLDRRHREIAQDNLRRAFPRESAQRIEQLARRSMQHLCMLGIEVLFTTRLVRLETYARYVRLENIKPVLELLLRSQHGLIMLTGHWGNWEILGYVLATLGFEVNVVARPLDNPYLDQWLLGVRQKKGQKMIAKKGATSEVTEALDQGAAVAFIADQDAGRKGLFVDFFGRPASTYKSIGLLAMQYQVPIVVGYAQRLDGEFHFAAGVQDVILPEQWGPQADPLRYITQRYTRAIEDLVQRDPAQYLWAHRRWKSQPAPRASGAAAASGL